MDIQGQYQIDFFVTFNARFDATERARYAQR
jgi:hypothetical protein